MKKRGIFHGEAPFLECSSAGDSRFSAFFARPRGYGGKSIEEIYQGSKVFEGGVTGLGWRAAKGRSPINSDQVKELYSRLWDKYIDDNPHLGILLDEATGLSDVYGKPGRACQATELWRIKTARRESKNGTVQDS